jgi:4a-hydroxytetrahydrobiopterin dehydratase
MTSMDKVLSRTAASDAVYEHGWRFLLGSLRASVPVASSAQAVAVAADAVAACGDEADRHLRIDLRPDRVLLTLQSSEQAAVTGRDVDLARRVTAAARAAGLTLGPEIDVGVPRSVQLLEIAVDALDIPAIRPFWKAVLGCAL